MPFLCKKFAKLLDCLWESWHFWHCIYTHAYIHLFASTPGREYRNPMVALSAAVILLDPLHLSKALLQTANAAKDLLSILS